MANQNLIAEFFRKHKYHIIGSKAVEHLHSRTFSYIFLENSYGKRKVKAKSSHVIYDSKESRYYLQHIIPWLNHITDLDSLNLDYKKDK